MIRLDLILHY